MPENRQEHPVPLYDLIKICIAFCMALLAGGSGGAAIVGYNMPKIQTDLLTCQISIERQDERMMAVKERLDRVETVLGFDSQRYPMKGANSASHRNPLKH